MKHPTSVITTKTRNTILQQEYNHLLKKGILREKKQAFVKNSPALSEQEKNHLQKEIDSKRNTTAKAYLKNLWVSCSML